MSCRGRWTWWTWRLEAKCDRGCDSAYLHWREAHVTVRAAASANTLAFKSPIFWMSNIGGFASSGLSENTSNPPIFQMRNFGDVDDILGVLQTVRQGVFE